jgi:hypothetical protein
MTDPLVSQPAHYTKGDIEAIQAIQASMSTAAFEGFLKGQVLKYLWRYRYKGKPTQDLDKARWYLERLAACVKRSAGEQDRPGLAGGAERAGSGRSMLNERP